jgi:hypothetical protein
MNNDFEGFLNVLSWTFVVKVRRKCTSKPQKPFTQEHICRKVWHDSCQNFGGT